MCLYIVPIIIFQTASLVYQKLAQYASMSDKLVAIIEFHRAGWCKNHFPHFCIWSILEAAACASNHDSVEAMKGSLKKAWDNIPIS